MKDFEVAYGSVAGTDHRFTATNNQDALYCVDTDRAIIAVVCDGCGSCKHSEVGAKIGSRLVVENLLRRIKEVDPPEFFYSIWERVRLDVLAQLRVLALSMGDSLTAQGGFTV